VFVEAEIEVDFEAEIVIAKFFSFILSVQNSREILNTYENKGKA
jgi:hypothetical protein